MAPNPPLGVVLHAIGGLCSAVFYLPYRKVEAWSWESYWLVGGVFSWIVAPWIIAWVGVPDLVGILREAPPKSAFWSYIFGAMWGIGGLSFGLTVRYLGVALGTSMALGYCAAFGTLVPPIFDGTFAHILGSNSGLVVLGGVLVSLAGIAICGSAGKSKEQEFPESEKKAVIHEFSFVKGFWVATFCGIMSACMSFGFAAGEPIAAVAVRHGASELWKNLPVLIIVLAGGFTSNFIWCLALNLKNGTATDYVRKVKKNQNVPILVNYALCAAAGTTWYLQFFFYGMGTSQMGRFNFSSWTLHMASIIIFGTLVGVYLGEWRGASRKTWSLTKIGLVALVVAMVVIGYGNYLAKPPDANTSSLSEADAHAHSVTRK